MCGAFTIEAKARKSPRRGLSGSSVEGFPEIINTLQRLDFLNGDFHHFFKHLATALAANY